MPAFLFSKLHVKIVNYSLVTSLKCMGFWPKKVWVIGYGRVMGFGADFPGNEHGGPEKVWVRTEYGV